MSKQRVAKAIKRVQSHVFEFQPNPPYGAANLDAPANNWETSTRYIIIDPILRSLGWDLSDPNQCVVEYRIPQNRRHRKRNEPRLDYVLLDERGFPVIAVEAKRIDVDDRDELNLIQMEEYIENLETVRVAVITNGQYWLIDLRDESGNWEGESDRPLGLHWHDPEETAERLHWCLAKGVWHQSN